MQITVIKPVGPEDTAALRAALKAAGFKVRKCRLGSNRYYILVHTDDNLAALDGIEKMGYQLDRFWRDTLDISLELFQRDHMLIRKVEA